VYGAQPAWTSNPASSFPHVPSDVEPSATEHTWHVPVHAELQQTPSAQNPVTQAVPTTQGEPGGSSWQTCVDPLHEPVAQSELIAQVCPAAHFPQSGPPQSTSVSEPFRIRSRQLAA
jgi:hypothetical protein